MDAATSTEVAYTDRVSALPINKLRPSDSTTSVASFKPSKSPHLGDPGIVDALVSAANDPGDPHDKQLVVEQLYRAIGQFFDAPYAALTDSILAEYNTIGCLNEEQKGLMDVKDKWFESLCNKVRTDDIGSDKLVCALLSVLIACDLSLLRRQASNLFDVADYFLRSITFDLPANYPSLCRRLSQKLAVVIECLRIMFMCDIVIPRRQGIYNRFVILIKSFKKRQDKGYYPLQFDADCAIQLVRRISQYNNWRDRAKHISIDGFKLLYATCRCSKGFMDIAMKEMSLDEIENGVKMVRWGLQLHTGFKNQVWFDWLYALRAARQQATQDPDTYTEFAERVEELENRPIRRRKSKIASRYGLILELKEFVLSGDNTVNRKAAAEKLLGIARRCADKKDWGRYWQLTQAAILALREITGSSEYQGKIEWSKRDLEEEINKWESYRDKHDGLLSPITERSSDAPESSQLLQRGLDPSTSLRSCPSCSGNLVDQSGTPLEEEIDVARIMQEYHQERADFMRTVKDIPSDDKILAGIRFRPVPNTDGGSECFVLEQLFDGEVKKVLILTALDGVGAMVPKEICRSWSSKRLWQNFRCVYCVSVEEIERLESSPPGNRTSKTLQTLLTNKYFSDDDSDKMFCQTRRQVQNTLNQESTLVIIDARTKNLDTDSDLTRAIFTKYKAKFLLFAKQWSHLLSKKIVQLVVEESDLMDEEISHIAHNALGKETATLFLREADGNEEIRPMKSNRFNLDSLIRTKRQNEENTGRRNNAKDGEIKTLEAYESIVDSRWAYARGCKDMQNVKKDEALEALENIACECIINNTDVFDRSCLDQFASASYGEAFLAAGYLKQEADELFRFESLGMMEYFAGRACM